MNHVDGEQVLLEAEVRYKTQFVYHLEPTSEAELESIALPYAPGRTALWQAIIADREGRWTHGHLLP